MQDIDYQACLQEIYEETKPLLGQGKVAEYIPALAEVDPNQYGIAIHTLENKTHTIGDAEIPFSIQSISKVFVFSHSIICYHYLIFFSIYSIYF